MAQRTKHRTPVHPELTQRRPVNPHPTTAEPNISATRDTGSRVQLEWDRSHGDP
jgi:hypothetical protein